MLYNVDKLLQEKQNDVFDDVYEIVVRVLLKKDKEQKQEAVITNLLTDIRSITRVTIVSSLDSKSQKGNKVVTIKIKFNVKNLAFEGYSSPQEFVNVVLIPTIQKFDTKPRILSVSPTKDTVSKRWHKSHNIGG